MLVVARSSVREAIKILTYLGVLESKRSEGTFVCSGDDSGLSSKVRGSYFEEELGFARG